MIMHAYQQNEITKYHVMLDSGANCGIFNNSDLLTNIRNTDIQATINGIGGQLTTNVVGTFNKKSDVFYHPEAIANLLSQSQEKDNGAKILYNNKHDAYLLSYEHKDNILFTRTGGFYCHDTSILIPRDVLTTELNTVNENKLRYTKRQVKKADEAIEVRRRLAYPSDATIPIMHSINNIPVSRNDLQRAVNIYGQERCTVRGKFKNRKSTPVVIESVWKPTDELQYLCVDLLFIDGDGYMIAVLCPLDYTIVKHIKSRKTNMLRGALLKILAQIDEQHYNVTHILSDREGGIQVFYDGLMLLKISYYYPIHNI